MSRHADIIRATVARDGSASAITASWRRCLNIHRLDPDSTEKPSRDVAALERAFARDAEFIALARPCLDRLFAMLLDIDCCVLLVDRDGLMVDVRTNRLVDAWQRKPTDWPGTCYAEEKLGTNSIGTCLAEQRSVIVRGSQHFLRRFTDRVGIAAPLFGPDGRMLGCIGLNQSTASHDARLDSFLSICLSNFARHIEAELFARAHPSTRLVLASPKGLRPDALLAVDADNHVIGATRAARRLLALGDGMIARAPNVDEIVATVTPQHDDDLAEVERRTIVRALAKFGGNHSAAAKAIGISRSTLYRKLKSYAPKPLRAAPESRPKDLKPRFSV